MLIELIFLRLTYKHISVKNAAISRTSQLCKHEKMKFGQIFTRYFELEANSAALVQVENYSCRMKLF
jgi:hypothetical protein